MKRRFAMLGLIIGLVLPFISNAEAAYDKTIVRCSGINSVGQIIGLDFELDSVDRITALTDFVADSAGVIDLESLGAPSVYLSTDAKGAVHVFGFKSFNDGLEEVLSVRFVLGMPSMSRLVIGAGSANTAVKSIECKTLNF
jgi:hypothetical protein